jgi:hypothetical protein
MKKIQDISMKSKRIRTHLLFIGVILFVQACSFPRTAGPPPIEETASPVPVTGPGEAAQDAVQHQIIPVSLPAGEGSTRDYVSAATKSVVGGTVSPSGRFTILQQYMDV